MNGVASADFGGIGQGFEQPVRDAQESFRAILDAMAHPGRIVRLREESLDDAPLGPAATAIALTLCDLDSPVWLDAAGAAAAGYLTFHCGAPLVAATSEARFAFAADAAMVPPLGEFALGSDEYPERSTTLVIVCAGLTNEAGILLTGPGIRDEIRLGVAGLPERLWRERAELAELFPRGIDMIFVSGRDLAALPRSTRILG